jgi:hypothetical protein
MTDFSESCTPPPPAHPTRGGEKDVFAPQSTDLPHRYRPTVDRYWLFLCAGVLWSLVGVTLCEAANIWFAALQWPANLYGALAGLTGGLLLHRFAFAHLVRKNIGRIARQPQRVCVFAFQAWQSYLLIVVMMGLGAVLRHSSLPRIVLATLYLGMGTALTLASSGYYEQL